MQIVTSVARRALNAGTWIVLTIADVAATLILFFNQSLARIAGDIFTLAHDLIASIAICAVATVFFNDELFARGAAWDCYSGAFVILAVTSCAIAAISDILEDLARVADGNTFDGAVQFRATRIFRASAFILFN